MRILYGVQCTGNGHIIRSSKIIKNLIRVGCDVEIIVSGNNSKLSLPFPIKKNFKGLTLQYKNNGGVNYFKTLLKSNPFEFIRDINLDLKSYDLVITDFEPITAWAAKFANKPSIGIGNQYSFYSKNTPRVQNIEPISEFVLKWFAPVDKPIGLHFEKYDDFIKVPIIRDSVYRHIQFNKGHYTVYLSNWYYVNLFNIFKNIDLKFEIFTNIKRPFRQKNCYFKPIERITFDESLKSSDGVITSGGFQTCSESLFLNKELIVIPNQNQYEQLCNGESLKRLGVKVGSFYDIGKLIGTEKTQIKVDWKDPIEEILYEILNF